MALMRNKKLVGLLIGGFIVGMTALGAATGLSRAEASLEWKPLSEIVSSRRLTEIVAESTAPSADRDAIASSAIGYEQGDLLIIDFRSQSLCGIGGCAVAGYRISTGDRILTTYAHRATSEAEIAELVDDKEGVDLPCISLMVGNNARPETLCYRGDMWLSESAP